MSGRLATLIRERSTLLRFLAVGVLNTSFSFGAFVTLVWSGFSSIVALVISWILGVLFSFSTIRAMVFTGQVGNLIHFVGIYLGVLAVNWAALMVLERLGLPAWIAQGVLTLPLALLSFAAQKRLVFTGRIRLA
jgi:putative flippase GtrA